MTIDSELLSYQNSGHHQDQNNGRHQDQITAMLGIRIMTKFENRTTAILIHDQNHDQDQNSGADETYEQERGPPTPSAEVHSCDDGGVKEPPHAGIHIYDGGE
jgi:hypothetical protein